MIKRNIETFADKVIHNYNKMLFVSGPRQSGKTTFAKMFADKNYQSVYVNWDIINDQKRIITNPYFFEQESRDLKVPFLVLFDEIHKYKNWKNYLKGCYDGFSKDFRFIVTGSGRLDLFKKGGDSIFGRYMAINLFPFTLGEITETKIDWDNFYKYLQNGFEKRTYHKEYLDLFNLSGFPEPYIKNEISFYNIWANERKKTLIKEDIRNAYIIKDISNIEVLSNLLPDKIGSPLSINSLREDIGVAFDSVKKWLLILQQFYYIFIVKPYSKRISRALKKEPKIYLYDWVEIEEEARRFENVVALHLYKAVSLWKGCGYGDFELFYIRDKEGREVDFLVTKNKKPLMLVEAKYSDEEISRHLLYFQQKLQVPYAIQVVHKSDVLKRSSMNNLTQYVISADNLFYYLP
ncbi:MAG: ATP-binding protein [Thermodesulfovibrionales bacterium]|nr:ATP-binding protein [Thermodesulfovibrionales bacterium]